MKRLEKYRALRAPVADVVPTPEPWGAEVAAPPADTMTSAFVVHQHDATNMHFDLRIEVDGTLLSFAIPKGPTLDPEPKLLAIRTEDHPLEYLDFEDVIPKGNYGAGPMILWDRGRVQALDTPLAKQIHTDKLDFVLYGFKLRGRFSLVKLKKEKDAYLLLKKPDAYAEPGSDIQGRAPQSVLSGCTVAELEQRRLGVPNPPARPLVPMPTLQRGVLGPGMLFDPVFDGAMVLAVKHGDVVTLTTSEGEDVASLYPEIVRSLTAHTARAFMVWGTLVVHDDAGVPSLSMLSKRLSLLSAFDESAALLHYPAQLVLLDAVQIEMLDLQNEPFAMRRHALRDTFRSVGWVRALDPFDGLPDAVLAFGRAQKLAGFVGAHANARFDVIRTFVPCDAALDAPRPSPAHTQMSQRDTSERRIPRATGRHTVSVTNRTKMFFPEVGITKGDLVDYYTAIAPAMLPTLRDRPVILTRFPDGAHGKSFFQWNVPPHMPSFLESYLMPGEGKRVFLLQEVESLMYVANLGCIPIHMLPYRKHAPELCDFLTLDFDVKVSGLARALPILHTLRDVLVHAQLRSWVKTSGQTGVHVLVPLGGAPEPLAKGLAELLGRILVDRHGHDATMERVIERRGDKVFVDVGQTGLSRAIVAPYAVRATPTATVSTPIAWDELLQGVEPSAFTVRTVLSRLPLRLWGDITTAQDDLVGALTRLGSYAR